MEENQKRLKKQIMFGIIGIAVLLISIVGVTYAFFNYTRTGSANTIRTGRIAFSSEQDERVTLSDLFPISATGTITPQTPGVGSVTVHVSGDTEYSGGIEYLVKAVNVTGANGTNLPISVNVSYEANGQGKTIGTNDTDYFVNRGGNTSLYKVLSNDTISEGKELVVGYIAPGQTGIDGNIVIMAYLDADNIAITDTYPEETVRSVITTNYSSSNCETALTGVTGAATYCASASALQDAIDNEDLDETQVGLLVTAGIVEEYTNGTTSSWVNGREVFTTEEWNSLQSSGVSFQIRVEANEGVWVPKTVEGNATVTATSATAASLSVTQGNIRYTANVSVNNNQLEFGVPAVTIEKYNEQTTSYDDITTANNTSREVDTVNITLQNANCNEGNAITVSNHLSGNFTDGLSTLDPTFVQCLITNNQP